MYTVKITGTGMIAYRNRSVRLPSTFKKVPKKDLKFLKVMCRSANVQMEILEEESERLASVVEKMKKPETQNIDPNFEIEGTETKIEDLFDSEDALGSLLKNIKKE